MGGLWTNRNSHGDFFQNGILEHQKGVSELYIAVAFYTDAKLLMQFAEGGCRIRMVVRLRFPTNPKSLESLVAYPNVELRYFSDRSFHPKLYIFGDRIALLGSANLTGSGLMTNQEVSVSIASDDPRFDELSALFSEYWNQAEVLTDETLVAYKTAHGKASVSNKAIAEIEREFESGIGKSVFQNIYREGVKKAKDLVFLDNYRKTYQESVSAYKNIAQVYESKNRRKTSDQSIPIRIEIDSFFSFIRDTHAIKEVWKETSLGWSKEKEQLVSTQIDEWMETSYEHFDEKICNENYPKISNTLGSPASIEAASYDQLVDSLVVLHSFHDRLRFFSGGLETLLNTFKQANDEEHLKESLKHLLFGKGDVVRRMADLIFDDQYKLNQFGQSNVQELVGWISNEDLPVLNGRTTKVLRYYGFDIRQL